MEPLPFSQASENNKPFILPILRRHLGQTHRVLEVGSGTGQHAEYFAAELPHLLWQSSDLAENIPDLNRRLQQADRTNLPAARLLDVTDSDWGYGYVEAIFTANSLHIMSESSVAAFFAGVGRHLARDGLLLVYGPFKYQGDFTTESNARFDEWLKVRNPVSGIRDFETVNSYAGKIGLTLLEDNPMPANNQLLVWRRTI